MKLPLWLKCFMKRGQTARQDVLLKMSFESLANLIKDHLRTSWFLVNFTYSKESLSKLFLKSCSDERKNGFKSLKLKRCKLLQPSFTPCEDDCFCLKTLKHFRFKCLRRFLSLVQMKEKNGFNLLKTKTVVNVHIHNKNILNVLDSLKKCIPKKQ